MSEYFGTYLREARESRDMTIEEVANETKIQKRYIEAIENENFSEIPGETYVKGFLKSYSAAVGLNVDDVIKMYEEYTGQLSPKIEKVDEDETELINFNVRKVINTILILGVIFLVYILVSMLTGEKTKTNKENDIKTKSSKELNVNEENKEEIKMTEDGIIIETGNKFIKTNDEKENVNIENIESKKDNINVKYGEFKRIEFKAKKKTWMSIKDGKKEIFNGILKEGENKKIISKNTVVIEVKNGNSIDVIYNNQNLGELSNNDEFITKSFK